MNTTGYGRAKCDRSEGAITLPQKLDDLAAAVRALVPDRRDPERFHIDKSEIVTELRRLARKVRHG